MAEKMNIKEDLDVVLEYKTAKQQLFVTLINKEMNKERTFVKKEFLDLYIVPRILVSKINGSLSASTTITPALMKEWDVSEDTILKDAFENMVKLKPAVIKNMDEILAEITGTAMPSSDLPIFVVTNEQMKYGAAEILYKKTLEELVEKVGEHLLIIPSSIHECIVIPADNMETREIASYIKEVNSQELAAEEVLSNHPYLYDPKNGLRMA